MRSFMSDREDLQVRESYEEFRLRTGREKPVTLNDILKQWEKEKREAERREALLVWWAIIRAAFCVLLIFLFVQVWAHLLVYGW
jgi:hypothetical protein